MSILTEWGWAGAQMFVEGVKRPGARSALVDEVPCLDEAEQACDLQ